MPVEITEEGKKWLERRGVMPVVPPLEAYAGGPPPEAEAGPLREEPLPPIRSAAELRPIIEHLRSDAKEMTQLRFDFNSEVGWVIPSPRFTIFFRKPEGQVVGALRGYRTPEELKEYQRELEATHPPGYRIERHYRADKNVWYFWAFPPERKSIYRSDPYLMAREVIGLNPSKLTIQTIPHIIRPPRAIPAEELPFRLRLLPPPRYST